NRDWGSEIRHACKNLIPDPYSLIHSLFPDPSCKSLLLRLKTGATLHCKHGASDAPDTAGRSADAFRRPGRTWSARPNSELCADPEPARKPEVDSTKEHTSRRTQLPADDHSAAPRSTRSIVAAIWEQHGGISTAAAGACLQPNGPGAGPFRNRRLVLI